MNCEDVSNLVPAYSLGTATVSEIAAVESHLLECDLHEGLAELRATAMLIAEGAAPVVPPTALKNRIMAYASKSTIGEREIKSRPRPRTLRRLLLANPIAAVLVVGIGLMVVWNITLQTADSPEKFTHYYWGNDNDWMRIETVLGEPGAEVSLGGIERLDDSLRYHLWTTRGDVVLFVGAFNVNPEG
ncbi:MAG: zf-HC2 domain-containing protein, partial [Chloroflexi bacterium]|nr:zf-HC2 domain-containing protein [Chloroflexota bacterium]